MTTENKIIIVTHKDYIMPNDSLYLPICVGKGIEKLKTKFQSDNVGDNISQKNKKYCELTGIYWAWKNIKAPFIGIAHYRRHYTLNKKSTSIDDVLTSEQLECLLKEAPIIVPTPKIYPFSSLKSHYINSKKGYGNVHKKDIEILGSAIDKLFPDYKNTFNKVMSNKRAHMLNMFIMRHDLFSDYCQWLFDILNEVEREEMMREDQFRYIGALSEFMLEIWLTHNDYKYKEVYLLELEKPSIIDKCSWIIIRKYFKKPSNIFGADIRT
ncbi:MAG: DUF4422 domain-containing protein [Clostridiaceae bacterium]